MPEAAPVLRVAGLHVRYGGVPAVRGIDVDVGAGEVVGLVGPNGAGKSTTLAAIMGLVPIHAGDVTLRGRSVAGTAPEEIARRGIALVPEGRHVFGAFTVAENLRLGLLGRASPDGAADDVAWVESLFPVVAEHASRRAGLLSGGQQQQLAIARALVADPAVLLLDEPSLGLAPTVVDTVFDALQRVRERGVAILLVEQRAELAIAFADRTHVMRDGRFVLDVDPTDATDVPRLTAAYFGT
jgi:branched-chain amino acid transport system ATP-binding protein